MHYIVESFMPITGKWLPLSEYGVEANARDHIRSLRAMYVKEGNHVQDGKDGILVTHSGDVRMLIAIVRITIDDV